jgi:WXXGXW repeat (2 copies)
MKKKLVKMLLLVAVLFTVSIAASAQVYVKVRPHHSEGVRPVRPSPDHVWIGEEWEPSGGSYNYSGGHWAVPSHRGYRWRSGYWRRHHNDGEEWVPGGWRR